MKIKYFLFFLLCLGCQSAVFSQKTIYISQRGDDNHTGKSPREAWKTLKMIEPGYTYLFNRGDTFYCEIPKIYNTSAAKPVVIGAYGSGNKPVLSLYKKIKPAAWQRYSDHIWRADMSNSNNVTGYTQARNNNIGFINIDGIIEGNRFFDLKAINTQWQLYADEKYLYIYSDKNPSHLRKQILASNEGPIITLSNYMTVKDIKLVGSGGHAIQGVEIKNVNLSNLEISEIGGAYLAGHQIGTRYGNGIEFWNGATNCLVSSCTVSQVYDVAFTMQGKGEDVYFDGVVFQNNIASNNEQTLEVWILGNRSGFKHCKFINNKGYNAGGGWSHTIRPDRNVGVHVLSYSWEVAPNASDLTIESNTFENATSGYMRVNYVRDKPFFKSRNNKILLKEGVPIDVDKQLSQSGNLEQLRKVTFLESGSVLKILEK